MSIYRKRKSKHFVIELHTSARQIGEQASTDEANGAKSNEQTYYSSD
jgi:hypothetical protein